jgi:hypothetical protein
MHEVTAGKRTGHPACLGTAGKNPLGKAGMLRQGFAGRRAEARDDVEHPGRQAGFDKQLR